MRVLICILIVLVSAPASAEWVKSWESKTSGTITYFDPDTIRKDGNLRRVWVLQELRIRGKEYGEMSRRALWEYNCPEGRFRSLQISFHTSWLPRVTTAQRWQPLFRRAHATDPRLISRH